ncbi:hypothetical protein BJ878DRAFT_431047 [Calycina marina]|uniref:DH domain-containing protein n=1 Tax=Calycina marina TaxID=1763456 RepID=A0A9P7YUB3_9HELO|nr:hypothetical protein BJ878DRAFT_431047 [Calycina marina]
MRELSTDETKYMRELKTLVDGVIPVLLTCVLSKTDSSIAAGLFSNVSDGPDPSFTKPIVDMGVALERLKSLHNRIPLEGSNALVTWLQNASRIYDDYLTAWRMGFQDVVVNLAPSSRSSSAAQTPSRDEMPLNANGDVVKDDGERVDVAFLLKRPLVRVKYLSKLVKGIHKLTLTDASSNTMQRWAELEIRGRRRIKEEAARMIDRAANNIDTTRARDPETLALIEDVKIDQTRQVCAKDSLELDMLHSSGQRVECEVELLLRDKPSDKSDPGDLLICAVDEANKWLLFPPVALSQVSARIGDSPDELVVMIRGDSPYWEEVFLLEADDDEAATEWVDMLGKTPIPPAVARDDVSIISKLATSILPTRQPSKKETDIAIPIGESRRRDAEEVVKKKNSASALLFARASDNSEPAPKNINEAMKKAGKTFTATKNARARYHSQSENSSPSNLLSRPTSTDSNTDHVSDLKNMDVDQGKYIMSGGLPFMPKKRASTDNMPLSESMRPDNLLKKERRKSAGALEDTPPPPPVHRMMSPKPQKSAPELESSTLNKHRRTSSPLKHEYQPSHASETSSSSSMSESEDGSYSDSSEDEELEGTELPGFEIKPLQPLRPKRSPSILSLPSTSLALSNSASQTPYRGVPVQRDAGGARKLVATISAWGGNKWVDLHPGPCSIVVSAGLIEVFEMNASHSSPKIDMYSEGHESEVSIERPLLAQILTPVVNLRQSTAVDIEIKSPATSNSLLKVDSATIRYRTYTVPACLELYAYIHKARCSNPVYEKLAQERMINSYGTHSYEAAVAGNRRRSFFGRKNSYRASNRAPASDNAQRSHSSSTFSRLRDSGIFNIAKSTIMQATGGSQYTESSRTSTFSGPTPPRTPTSPSLSSGTTSGANIVSLGNKNLKIRLYMLANSTSWDDKGSARLDITVPPAGMRQRSSLYTGIERRIVVRVNAHKGEEGVVILDEVLGTSCFQQISRTGIAVNVWEDISDDNGEVGRVGKTGGVSGRTRKWLLQTGSAAERNWIYSLCATAR